MKEGKKLGVEKSRDYQLHRIISLLTTISLLAIWFFLMSNMHTIKIKDNITKQKIIDRE